MKIFIAGPRAIKELDNNVIKKLESISKNQYNILVGDASGIDSSVQKFFNSQNYKYVTVYASNGFARNNYGNWRIKRVIVENNVTGFDFYAKKDKEMAKDSDIGFMIWNGKSKRTFNNIINLLNLKKEVILYYTLTAKFYHFKQLKDLEKFINTNVKMNSSLRKLLPQKESKKFIQACMF